MELTEVQKEADSAGRKAMAFGFFALLLAGLFGWMLAHLASSGPDTKSVVVASVDIPALSTLKLDELKVVEWPAASMPAGTFDKPEDIIKTGLMNVQGLKVGEPVLSDRLSTSDRGLGMSQMVEPNMRAYVVRVDDAMATSEILHPGAFVDVFSTLEDQKNRATVTKLILQNVQVLGVGDSVEVERSRPRDSGGENMGASHDVVERHRVVTLAVQLADTEMLTFASRYGKIDLSLRNNNDNVTTTTQGVTLEKLLGRAKKAPEPDVAAESPDAAAGSAPAGDNAGGSSAPAPAPRRRRASSSSQSNTGPAIIRVNNH